MNVSLPPELEQYVEREIAAGKFRSHAEAVAETLWLLRGREERQDRLRSELQSGIDQLEHGQAISIKTADDQSKLLSEIERLGQAELEEAAD